MYMYVDIEVGVGLCYLLQVIQRLQGVMCQKVCAGNLFSIVLSVTGQVSSNCSTYDYA